MAVEFHPLDPGAIITCGKGRKLSASSVFELFSKKFVFVKNSSFYNIFFKKILFLQIFYFSVNTEHIPIAEIQFTEFRNSLKELTESYFCRSCELLAGGG